MSNRTAILFLGHGSRVAASNQAFEALSRDFEAYLAQTHPTPPTTITHGFIELAKPFFGDVLTSLAANHDSVVILPAFLFTAGHLKNDVPLAVEVTRAQHPHCQIILAAPVGADHRMAEATWQQAIQHFSAPQTALEDTHVVVVGRGSSDPDANSDFFKLARLMTENRGMAAMQPCFIGITTPLVEPTLEHLARSRPARIWVIPYMLFAGRLMDDLQTLCDRFAQRFPWVRVEVAPTLGVPPVLLAVLAERWQGAVDGSQRLPCDACQYRFPVGAVATQVGGLQALLWSVRHGLTHSQAMPHTHAHKPLSKHVLVCGNVECADKGSIELLSRLRQLVKKAGLKDKVRITRTSCLGRCGEGPNVNVYPDGIWYRNVTPEDAPDLVEEHLKHDRLLARCIDTILQ